MTSDSTPRAFALSFRHVCRRSYRSLHLVGLAIDLGARWAERGVPAGSRATRRRRAGGSAPASCRARPQVVGAARHAPCELHQRRFSHHLERRTVQALGLLLAVREERLENGGLCRRESRAPLTRQNAAGSGPRVVRVAAQPRQAFEFLVRLLPAAGSVKAWSWLSRSAAR